MTPNSDMLEFAHLLGGARQLDVAAVPHDGRFVVAIAVRDAEGTVHKFWGIRSFSKLDDAKQAAESIVAGIRSYLREIGRKVALFQMTLEIDDR